MGKGNEKRDQGDDLARIDGERDILYGVDVAVVDVDAVHLQSVSYTHLDVYKRQAPSTR